MKWIFISPLLLFSSLVSAFELTVNIPGRAPIIMSMNQLKSELPRTQFTTVLPWLPKNETATFSGFTLFDLIAHLKLTNVKSVTFTALNDYKASAPFQDIEKYRPIIAYSMNDEPMKIRDKGPFWFLYNLSKYKEVDSPGYHTQMVWQIKEISLNYQ